MKKIFLLINTICILFAGCSNGAPRYDWTYNLPNSYEINHINSRCIIMTKEGYTENSSFVIDEYIIEFCYNERYVCVKCVDVPADIKIKISTKNPEYYIVDTIKNKVTGPVTITHINDFIVQNLNFGNWISTLSQPDGAIFE